MMMMMMMTMTMTMVVVLLTGNCLGFSVGVNVDGFLQW